MTARTVEPLYDQALEGMLEGEVGCELPSGCLSPAEWAVRFLGLCECRTKLCDRHEKRLVAELASVSHGPVRCYRCATSTDDGASLILISRPI